MSSHAPVILGFFRTLFFVAVDALFYVIWFVVPLWLCWNYIVAGVLGTQQITPIEALRLLLVARILIRSALVPVLHDHPGDPEHQDHQE